MTERTNTNPSQSPATLMDVAREAGVSIATASRALNGGTRKVRGDSYAKVMRAANKLSYRPNAFAQAVAKGSAPTIVLLVSDISDPYFSAVSSGVIKTATERNITVTIAEAHTAAAELESAKTAIATRPRGIIIASSEHVGSNAAELDTELRRYTSNGGHVAFVMGRGIPYPAVDVANEAGARSITSLIVSQGYRRPAIMHGEADYRASMERLAGALDTLRKAGIEPDPNVCVNGRFTRTDGYAAVMQMHRQGLLLPGEHAAYDGQGVDVIIALNDVMAIGAMTALRDCGITPGEQIAVTGFGDIPYSADVYPPLTTVHLPLFELGKAAAEEVLRDDAGTAGTDDDAAEPTGASDPRTTHGRLIFVQSTPDVVLRESLPVRR